MSPQRLRIFQKKKGFYMYPYQWFGVFFTLILVGTAYYFYQFGEYDIRKHLFKIGVVLLMYWIGFEIYNYFRYQKERGEYKGELIFYKDKIQVGSNEFLITKISKIDFVMASDIRGRHIWGDPYRLGPQKSNGLGNKFILKLNNGEVISDNFLQTEGQRLKLFKDILIHYYKIGILDWLQLIAILGIKDYQKIQQFKNDVEHPSEK